MILHTYDARKQKKLVAGEFSSGVFTKTAKPFHFMVIEQGYGIAEDVIQKLITLGCVKVVIKTAKSTKEILFSELLKKPIKNYGSGKQRFV